jgi:hypothetical protein
MVSKKTKFMNIENVKFCIEFLNKEKGFKKDVIYFDSYENAIIWAKSNFEKFDLDMIKCIN